MAKEHKEELEAEDTPKKKHSAADTKAEVLAGASPAELEHALNDARRKILSECSLDEIKEAIAKRGV